MNIFRRKSVQPSGDNNVNSSASNNNSKNNNNSAGQSGEAAPTTRPNHDIDPEAPLVTTTEGEPTPNKRRRSSLFKKTPPGEKKKLISDSGPYIFAFDPRSGKEVLQKNPHWPYEDSWKREEVRDRGETDSTVAPGGLGFGVNTY